MPTRLANAAAPLSSRPTRSISARPARTASLGIMLMRLRIAKIGEDAVAHILGDIAPEPRDHLGHGGVICRRAPPANLPDQGEMTSAVEPTKSQNITVSCRRSASAGAKALGVAARDDGCRNSYAERRNSIEQFAAMTDRSNADLFQILRCELRQHLLIDLVIPKQRLIALQAQICSHVATFMR